MKKILSLYVVFILFITVFSAAGNEFKNPEKSLLKPPIEWEKTYGSAMVDWGRCVQQTSDGGYIISGAYDRNVYMPWQGYVYLLKIDAMGNQEWEKQHGIYPYENLGQYIQQTSDGGYIIAGFIGYTYHIDAYVLKTDSAGDLTWTRILGHFDYYDNSLSVQETTDNGYIITGWTGSYGAGSSDTWLIKLNSSGEDEWNTTFGGSDLDGGECVRQTSDEGYIISGSTESFDSGGNGDAWLIKTDMNGNEIWNKSYGGQYLDIGKSVIQTSDGGYVLTGSTSSYGAGNHDAWLIKTDMYGNEIWNNTYGDSSWDQGKSVVQTADGGYFITGDYTDPIQGDLELYMIKTDSDGIEEWNYIIEHESLGSTDSGSYGIQTNDGGYIATGETGEYNLAKVDLLLIKLEGTNSPPNIPSNPDPQNGSTGVDINTDLSWSGGDPDGDLVTYDVYFGTDTNPPLMAEDIVETYYDPGILNCNATYYWKIIAKDNCSASTEGPIWEFTTEEYELDLSFTIKGGLGANVEITNNNIEDAEDIEWEIHVEGGILGLINKTTYGIIDVPAGELVSVGTGFLFGLGSIDIKATVASEEKSATGIIIIILVYILN